jgi:hypothetical protein
MFMSVIQLMSLVRHTHTKSFSGKIQLQENFALQMPMHRPVTCFFCESMPQAQVLPVYLKETRRYGTHRGQTQNICHLLGSCG